MEGRWRVSATVASLVACSAIAAGGCGSSDGDADEPGAIATADPATTFAPTILLPAGERYRPLSARWFVERSVLWFAEGQGCDDRKIAVGRTLGEQRGGDIDWIWHHVLGGRRWAYYRSPWNARCEPDLYVRAYANQHVRPHDVVDRPSSVRPQEGFYLDLVDSARSGPRALDEAVVYVERADAPPSVRLTYWLMFGEHAPAGRPAETHEGDWERVDVLLRRDADGRYEPRAVRLGARDAQGAPAQSRDVPRSKLRWAGRTHPILVAARGSHTLTPPGRSCEDCTRWQTHRRLEPLRKQGWYGFGGAWGEVGQTGATTGPLGPHDGTWPD